MRCHGCVCARPQARLRSALFLAPTSRRNVQGDIRREGHDVQLAVHCRPLIRVRQRHRSLQAGEVDLTEQLPSTHVTPLRVDDNIKVSAKLRVFCGGIPAEIQRPRLPDRRWSGRHTSGSKRQTRPDKPGRPNL